MPYQRDVVVYATSNTKVVPYILIGVAMGPSQYGRFMIDRIVGILMYCYTNMGVVNLALHN